MNFLYYTLFSLLIFIALLMIGLILIQKGRGGGLSNAFGGGGGSTAFGSKTGDVLTWATSAFFGLFILLAVLLDLVVTHKYPSAAAAQNPIPAVTSAQPQTPPVDAGTVTPPIDQTPPPDLTSQPIKPITTQRLVDPSQPVPGRVVPAPELPTSIPTSAPTTRP